MSKRRSWAIVGAAVVMVAALVCAGAAAYWRYANWLPPYAPPVVRMPSPNARNDFLAALPLLALAPNQSPADFLKMSVAEHRAAVARMQPALTRFRRGLNEPFRDELPTSTSQGFSELGDYRHLARCLAAEGKLAEREGRLADAARSYADCIRLGVKLPRGGAIIHQLVGAAIEAIGHAPLYDLCDRLDAPTAARAARELGEFDAERPPLAETVACEREYGILAIYELPRQRNPWRQLTDPMSTTPPSLSDQWEELKFALTPKSALLGRYRRYMDSVAVAAVKPYHAGPVPPPPPDRYLELVAPVFDGMRFSAARGEAQLRVLRLRLAARAYAARQGEPAPHAGVLVPAYLPSLPADPFAPGPLVYRVRGGRALVYSRGPDGDDDGGRTAAFPFQSGSDGDLLGPIRRSTPGVNLTGGPK